MLAKYNEMKTLRLYQMIFHVSFKSFIKTKHILYYFIADIAAGDAAGGPDD